MTDRQRGKTGPIELSYYSALGAGRGKTKVEEDMREDRWLKDHGEKVIEGSLFKRQHQS